MKQLFKRSHILPLICFFGLILTGCNDDEDKKIGVKFESSQTEVQEGDTVIVKLILDNPARRKEYLTLSVQAPSSEFGVDFGIGNLLTLENEFSITVDKDSTESSFTFIALMDFKNDEDIEQVTFSVDDATEGILPQTPDTHVVRITSVENYSDDNRALLFDGVDDHVNLGDVFDDISLPVTISAWIWLDPSVQDGIVPIFESQDGMDVYRGFNFTTSNLSEVTAQYGTGWAPSSGNRRLRSASFAPIMGRWVNFTAVITGPTDIRLYVNGVDVGGTYSGGATDPMSSSSPTETAKIGYLSQNGTIFRFKGKMDELKIWNRSLTVYQVQDVIFRKLDETEPGLIGYWNFDEPNGPLLIDRSKNTNLGIIQGDAQRVLSEVPVR
ncbi:MAG TPA: LamG domain-containing protein [Chryseolinea sp.]|nr:LamG domain-containing protein [Chryseolinea sp.]